MMERTVFFFFFFFFFKIKYNIKIIIKETITNHYIDETKKHIIYLTFKGSLLRNKLNLMVL